MNIYEIGKRITLNNNIPATIEEILIKSRNFVLYHVVWWSGRDRKTEWVTDREFEPEDYRQEEIGFIK